MKRNPPTIKDNPPTKVFVFILATLLSPWIALGLYTFRSDVKATFDQIPRRVEVHFNKQNRQIELDILELVNKTLELIERREAAIPDRITLMKTRQPKNVFKDPFLVGDTSEVKAIHHVSLNLEYWCKGPVSRSTSTVHDYKDKLIWIIFDCDLPIYDLWIELCINFVKNVVFGLFYTGLWFSVGVCMHLLEMRINKRNNVIRVESYDEKLPPIAVEDNQDDQKQLIKTSSDTAEPTAIQYDQKASSDNTLTASHQQKASGTSKCQNHATQVEVPSSPVLIRFDRGISSSQEYDSDSSCNDHSLMEKLEQASNHVGTGTVPNTDALPANQIGCAVKVKASDMQKTRYFFVYSAVIVLLIGVTVHVILQSEGSFNQVGARFNELDPKVRWDLVNLIEITLSQIRKVGLAVPMRITMLRRPEQGRNLFRKPFLSGDTREVKAVHYISSTVENWCMGSGLSTAVTKYEHGDHDILVRFDCNMPTTRSPSKGYILLGIGAVMFASLSLAIVSMRLKQEMVAKLAIEYNEHEIELPTEPSKPGNDSEREAENAKSTNSADVLEKCSIEVVKHPENPEDGEEDAALLEDFDIIDMKEASVR